MIVRLMGLGQWVMEPEQLLELNEIDEAVEAAVEAGDQAGLRIELERLVAAVQANGSEVPDDLIVESDLVLPDVNATLDEVRELLASTSDFYGLVPDSHQLEGDDVELDAEVGATAADHG
ncbi:MAG: hypothetical protein Q4D96_08830 [Propionibacteriaceae bacterium]|nr:hypothetical protein [Propionibacteriaceae bacterium]